MTVRNIIKSVFSAAIIGTLLLSFVPYSYAASDSHKKEAAKSAHKTTAKKHTAKASSKAPAKKTSKPAAKKSAVGPGKYKSSGPIEITSDSLQVLQQERKAIFTGHVLAVQGDVHIKSEKMTVFYKNADSSNDKEKATAKKDKAAAGDIVPEKNGIEKIVVEDKVFLSTPEETASGAHGLYDVVNHKIFLNDNVVLTRDKNILKGDRLVYDFETGKSELNAPGAASTSAGGADKPKQRVKALFVPDDKKEDTKKEPAKK